MMMMMRGFFYHDRRAFQIVLRYKVFCGIPPHPLELADHSTVYQECFMISVVDIKWGVLM